MLFRRIYLISKFKICPKFTQIMNLFLRFQVFNALKCPGSIKKARKRINKKSNGEQSDPCDLEQVTLKPQLQVHYYLTTWLQIWYHSLLRGYSIQKSAGLEKQNCLSSVHPAELGKLTLFSFLCDSPHINQSIKNKTVTSTVSLF